MEIVTDCELRPNTAMGESRKDIVRRLRVIPEAFDLTDAELCRRIGCSTTAWANYVSPKGKRVITRKIAMNLCDEFNLTLDFIYRGKMALIPPEIANRMREAA